MSSDISMQGTIVRGPAFNSHSTDILLLEISSFFRNSVELENASPFRENSIETGTTKLHDIIVTNFFLITSSSTRCTPVSNRPLLSGGDSSCSWVFYLCTGPKGWILTLQEGCQLGSTCVSHARLYFEYPSEYSHKRTQTSSFSCKVYWENGTGSWNGVTAIQWNATYKSRHCIVNTHAIAIHTVTFTFSHLIQEEGWEGTPLLYLRSSCCVLLVLNSLVVTLTVLLSSGAQAFL